MTSEAGSIDEAPGFTALRLTLGMCEPDELVALETYARSHGYAPRADGSWRLAPRMRRPDPAPISGEIDTRDYPRLSREHPPNCRCNDR